MDTRLKTIRLSLENLCASTFEKWQSVSVDRFNYINTPTKEDKLLPLQLSAREGESDLTKRLLMEGALVDDFKSRSLEEKELSNTAKPPIYHAVERGQLMDAQYLLAWGADKDVAMTLAADTKELELQNVLNRLRINPGIAMALLTNLICFLDDRILKTDLQFEEELLRNYLSPDFSAVINKALTDSKIVNEVVRSNAQVIKYCSISFPKQSYYDILHGLQDLATLHKNHEIAKILMKVKAQLRLNGFPLHASQSEEKLSAKQKSIYEAAMIGKIPSIKPGEEDLYAVMSRAHHDKHIVALYTLAKLGIHSNLLKQFILNEHKDLAFYWMTFFNLSPFKVALDWVNDPSNTDDEKKYLLKKLIEQTWTITGAFQSIISRSIANEDPLPQLWKLYNLLPENEDKAFLVLRRCIRDHYNISLDHYRWVPEAKPAKLQILEELSDAKHDIVTMIFKRFGVQVLPNPTLAFGVKPKTVVELEAKLAAIQNFRNQITYDINHKSYCERRFHNWGVADYLLVGTTVGVGISFGLAFGYYFPDKSKYYNQLTTPLSDYNVTTTCADLYHVNNFLFDRCPSCVGFECCDVIAKCVDPCWFFNDKSAGFQNSFIAGSVLSFLTLTGGINFFQRFLSVGKWGAKRFHSATPAEISPGSLEAEIKLLEFFAKLKEHDLFKNIKIEKTEVGQVLSIATRVEEDIKVQLKEWHLPALEIKIEEHEEDKIRKAEEYKPLTKSVSKGILNWQMPKDLTEKLIPESEKKESKIFYDRSRLI